MQAGSLKSLALVLTSVLALPIATLGLPVQEAFADGLTMETFSASLGDRQAQLLVRVNPPILTDASRDDAYMLLRLYDANTNQTIRATTFIITAEKGIGENAQHLFTDTFYSDNGILRLKIQPAEGPLQFFGTREQFLNAWVADPGGTVNIRGPMFLEGGIYHLRIDILGIDNIRNLFPPDQIPRFDSWLSVGDIFTQQIEYQGQPYNTTIISYYDEVSDFNFDVEKQELSWSMPFDWNVTRLEDTNIFVHEEVQIPKSLAGLWDATSFAATVNGNPVSGRMLAIDPYTSQEYLTLHYLINKNDILSMAERVPAGSTEMTFTLAPATGNTAQTTGEMLTDTGNVNVLVEWTPTPLRAETDSTVKLTFSDGFSGERINGDVNYNLRILDLNGTQVYSESDLVAQGGEGTQTLAFPHDETYRMEVEVTGIVTDGGDVDMTRNGVARGIVVVPEFPAAGALITAAGIISTIIAAQRFGRNKKKMPGI
ncbi:MAG TPA: hypothetical protein VNI77_02285 [Nitrososphaera sp.]|nr:hypothetical protein [Nitrososphaera sp.]